MNHRVRSVLAAVLIMLSAFCFLLIFSLKMQIDL